MKKIILLAACLIIISTTINAQEVAKKSTSTSSVTKTEKATKEKITPEQRAQKNVDDLNSVASLSDDQKTKVKELATARISKADAIRAKYKGQPENKETQDKELVALRKEYRQTVQALLTPEQQEKVKAKNKEMKAAKKAENSIDAND